jgi:hypothetical protein
LAPIELSLSRKFQETEDRHLAVARLQWNCNRATANWHYTHAMYQAPFV